MLNYGATFIELSTDVRFRRRLQRQDFTILLQLFSFIC